jgi:hypothetical protein
MFHFSPNAEQFIARVNGPLLWTIYKKPGYTRSFSQPAALTAGYQSILFQPPCRVALANIPFLQRG